IVSSASRRHHTAFAVLRKNFSPWPTNRASWVGGTDASAARGFTVASPPASRLFSRASSILPSPYSHAISSIPQHPSSRLDPTNRPTPHLVSYVLSAPPATLQRIFETLELPLSTKTLAPESSRSLHPQTLRQSIPLRAPSRLDSTCRIAHKTDNRSTRDPEERRQNKRLSNETASPVTRRPSAKNASPSAASHPYDRHPSSFSNSRPSSQPQSGKESGAAHKTS